MADVLIALGGNVGDVRTTFRKAIANICGMTQAALVARSSDYSTPPWGDQQQDSFINACIEIETARLLCFFASANAARSALRFAFMRAFYSDTCAGVCVVFPMPSQTLRSSFEPTT